MTKPLRCLLLGFSLVFVFATSELSPQSTPPQAYSLKEKTSIFEAVNTEIYRDGSKILVDTSVPPDAPRPKGVHFRTLYDFQADRHRSYTWDLIDTSVPCGASTYFGEPSPGQWGNPFAIRDWLPGTPSENEMKQIGTETVNGIATKVLEYTDPSGQGKLKLWLEAEYGLVVKYQRIGKDGQQATVIEVQQFSPSPPPASLFVLPPVCAKAAAAPAPPTESEQIAAATGSNAEDFDIATTPPASQDSCALLFRIVRAGTMEPITSGFQVELDTSGGGLREVTGQARNGILRIDNPPPHFDMLVKYEHDFSHALVYRHCFRPQTALLYVAKQDLTKDSYFLYAKSGKFVTVSAPVGGPGPAAGGQVTAVRAVAVRPQADYKGPYPGKLEFVFSITSDGPAEVKYIVVNQSGAVWKADTLSFAGAETKEFALPFKVGIPGALFEGWTKLKVYQPNKVESEQLPFSVDCRP